MIKLNRIIASVSMMAVLAILFVSKISQTHSKEDLLANMSNGLTDSLICEIYAEDILDVESITFSKVIQIKYYDYDLNEDGNVDKIVTIQSPIHSGSHGDALDFLIATDNGSYRRISNLTVQMYGKEKASAKMFILNDITNGFHDILIHNGKRKIVLKYQNDYYAPAFE